MGRVLYPTFFDISLHFSGEMGHRSSDFVPVTYINESVHTFVAIKTKGAVTDWILKVTSLLLCQRPRDY